jgi:hypothetical protein
MQSSKNLQKMLEPPESLRMADFTTVFTQPFTVHTYVHTDEALSIQSASPIGDMDMDVVYRSDWTERSFLDAKTEVMNKTKSAQITTLMILPYLSEKHLQELLQAGLNGLDLCGNAIIKTANEFIWLSGKPNKFRINQNLKNPYAGKSALVGRMLLEQPVFRKLEDFRDAIHLRGAELSIAMISRVIKEMRAEIIVDSWQGNKIYLLQPEKLLDQLTEAWKSTAKQSNTLWRGKISQPINTFLPKIFTNANSANLRAVMTGVGSVSHYTNVGMENTAYIYAYAVEPLLSNLEAQATEFFPNLEIRRPPNETVYFNAYTDDKGIHWTSLLQTYLEMCNDDIRLQQSAIPLRQRLLEETLKKREVTQ